MEELEKLVVDLLIKWGLTGTVKYWKIALFFLIGGGTVVLTTLWKFRKFLIKHFQQYKLKKDMYPFFSDVEVKQATQFYIPTKCQNIPPSAEDEPLHTHAFATKNELLPFFINNAFKFSNTLSDQRFYIILADSGMGKTTFMLKLYQAYVSRWFGKKYDIKLFPMGYYETVKEIEKEKDEKKKYTILLLDAFDEDPQAVVDYKKRIDDLLQKVQHFRKVIITCRTQFFPSEQEEPNETGIMIFSGERGYHRFHKLYISPFDDNDIDRYLSKRFSFFKFKKKKKAKLIVKSSQYLMVRPMLLNYIDDLLKSERSYTYSFEVYEELINRWIERESRFYKEPKRENFKKELYKFSREVARDIYQNRDFRKGLFIDKKDIETFASKQGIQLDLLEMKNRSLLNRNAQGQYKFSHKSILEYFLAYEAVENYEFYKEFSFGDMDQARRFYDDLWQEIAFRFFIQGELRGSYRHSENGINIPLTGMNRLDLKKIIFLDISDNHLIDLNPLKELITLRHLNLSQNKIIDIRPIEKFIELKKLFLSQNNICDIESIKGMKNLEEIYLSQNQISDIKHLKKLEKLKYLHISQNQLSDIEPIAQLSELEFLDISQNKIFDIELLKLLKKLAYLNIIDNPISFGQIKKLIEAIPDCKIDY